ncbi:hypothetical protein B0H13DRAFT_1880359 [Mycena leptocephala]|nr:hypothetical protein B0H13DRAFT_1880359 [Mycena leptocephala]
MTPFTVFEGLSAAGQKPDLAFIIVEGQETVLCCLNKTQDMKFYHADLTFNAGHVVQKEELKGNHELLKEETEFKIDVFEHYNFVISVEQQGRMDQEKYLRRSLVQ